MLKKLQNGLLRPLRKMYLLDDREMDPRSRVSESCRIVLSDNLDMIY